MECYPIDFAKAYDSVHHNYMTTFFLDLALPVHAIAVLMFTFKAPFVFAVGRVVVKDAAVTPASGAKSGFPQVQLQSHIDTIPSELIEDLR